ncbi:MAG: hypothetical protein C0392_13305 [Syntrophus sp. (in: bacteria)]|nr:hypothetical protein [Syntrophus sp. (in: bacteria)]
MRYKGFLIDKNLINKDPHFQEGCTSCHLGDEKAKGKENAHRGVVIRPSDNLAVCAPCHEGIAKTFKDSLHYTTHGLKHGVSGRFSGKDLKTFNEKVFEKSCRSCHATCGDCHVKSPSLGGASPGLLKGHKFVKRDDGKTCALCHGGRVYPEFTGEYGGSPDIHYQKGMVCIDCHTRTELHGSGVPYKSRKEIKEKPACINCHPAGNEKNEKARAAHGQHKDRLSCYACHSGGEYRNCYDCHLGKGATSKPGFFLGISPRDRKTVTTLRLIPAKRDTFSNEGIKMEKYDILPNYWDTAVHNIKKRTDRTRSCEVCHIEKKDFLTESILIKNGSKANKGLLIAPKPIKNRREK